MVALISDLFHHSDKSKCTTKRQIILQFCAFHFSAYVEWNDEKNFWITLILELYVSGSETSRFHLKCIQKCREKGCNRLACVCMCQWKCDRLSEQRKYEVSSVHEKNYRCLMTSCLSVDIEKNWRKKNPKSICAIFSFKNSLFIAIFVLPAVKCIHIYLHRERVCVCVDEANTNVEQTY